MLSDPVESLQACLNHILPNQHWDREVIQTAVEANSFRRQSGRPPGQTDPSAFLRKGQVGSWRIELAPDTLDQIQPDDRALLEHLLLQLIPLTTGPVAVRNRD